MQRSNVVDLKGRTTMDQSRISRQPTLIPQCRDLVKDQLANALRQLFNNADDALFEMADKAGSNGDQTRYLDAMRELRLNKKIIATSVLQEALNRVDEIERNGGSKRSEQSEQSLDELGLVEKDELELSVAIETMSSRIRTEVGQEMEDLRCRLELVTARQHLVDEDIPGSPETLCKLFVEATDDLDVSIQARLVILKLFEKHVLKNMIKAYSQMNDVLVKNGVLSDMKAHRTQTANKPANPGGSAGSGAKGATMSEDESRGGYADQMVDEIPTLTVSYGESNRHGTQNLDDIHTLLSKANSAETGDLPILPLAHYPQHQLVESLSHFQAKQVANRESTETCQVIDFRRILNARLGSEQETTATFNEFDDDVINLVSMLFEFILDDRELQPAMKALIARLQIPILKVALIDKSFFSKGGHPARQLLNLIASSAIGWNEAPTGRPDHLKAKIEYVVDTVLKEFEDNVGLFSELLEEFKVFVDKEDRRRTLIERRINDAEIGKAENERAQKQVQDQINLALNGKALPETAGILVNEGLGSAMLLSLLKNGASSQEWGQITKLLNDFVWTFHPEPVNDNTRSLLLSTIPKVMGRLKKTLAESAYDHLRAEEQFKAVESEHIQVLGSLQSKLFSAPARTTPQKPDGISSNGTAETNVQVAINNTEGETSQATNAQQPEAVSLSEVSPATIEPSAEKTEPSAQKTEPSAENTQPQDAPINKDVQDIFLQQVAKLAPGGWFEFIQDDKNERCKLAAIVKIADKFVFVNRSSIKVAEKNSVELAQGLQDGSIQMLNDGLLFDRALESVITGLRNKAND